MSDAPERMWARKSISGNCVVSFSTPSEEYCIEYVRADLHHSLALDVVAAGGQAADAYAAQLKAEAMAAKLAEALTPFVAEASHWEKYDGSEQLVEGFADYQGVICVDDLRNAASAIAEYEASK